MRRFSPFSRVRVDDFNKGFGDLGASDFGEAEFATETVDRVGFGEGWHGGAPFSSTARLPLSL